MCSYDEFRREQDEKLSERLHNKKEDLKESLHSNHEDLGHKTDDDLSK